MRFYLYKIESKEGSMSTMDNRSFCQRWLEKVQWKESTPETALCVQLVSPVHCRAHNSRSGSKGKSITLVEHSGEPKSDSKWQWIPGRWGMLPFLSGNVNSFLFHVACFLESSIYCTLDPVHQWIYRVRRKTCYLTISPNCRYSCSKISNHDFDQYIINVTF